MSLSKKFNLWSDFAAGVYLSEVPSPFMTPYSSTPYTLYVYVYKVYLFTQGMGEGIGES